MGMGIVRVALIVFSIASILVLAGFSTILNEKAYAGNEVAHPFGDFKCWKFVDGTGIVVPPALVSIQDQFGTIENSDWTQLGYCAAAEKNGQPSPFSLTTPIPLAQHYQGWLYPLGTRGAGTDTTVIITVPQFEQTITIRLGDVDSILVPTTKFTTDEGQVDSFDMEQHWNCYLIEQQPDLNVNVNLVTQHGLQNADVLDPFLLCAPMIKTDLFEPFDQFGTLFDEHLLCYDLRVNNPGTDLPIQLQDQLSADPQGNPIPLPVILGSEELLCAPALKSFPLIGGTIIPLDTTSLLLAGTQMTASWLIPVIVSAIGIGIVIARKF